MCPVYWVLGSGVKLDVKHFEIGQHSSTTVLARGARAALPGAESGSRVEALQRVTEVLMICRAIVGTIMPCLGAATWQAIVMPLKTGAEAPILTPFSAGPGMLLVVTVPHPKSGLRHPC